MTIKKHAHDLLGANEEINDATNTHLIVQASRLGHGGQWSPLPADVAEDLENHEAEEEEVEASADPGHDDESHLSERQLRK